MGCAEVGGGLESCSPHCASFAHWFMEGNMRSEVDLLAAVTVLGVLEQGK